MSDWTDGYVAEIGYTYGYFNELNPQRLKLAFLNAGLAFPQVGTACELGFGQGVSINVHAAASVTRWHGTDFNPAQAAFAQELGSAAGANAQLYDEAFDQFCSRPDLPDFDYIGLHGIWSWISDENRRVIVDFVRRKLKVGGVLYISYNTQPGWAAMGPMRELLAHHAEVMGSDGGGIIKRIEDALEFSTKLLATNPGYALANPQVVERLKLMKDKDRHYLAHEYFNRDWQPMLFAKMAEWMAPAKVQWACSANYLESVDAINLTEEQQVLLKGIRDPLFRQMTRDFCVNQSFRKDYWIKGLRTLSALEQVEQMRQQRVMLVRPPSEVTFKVTGTLGEANLQESVYQPIIDLLADYKPKSIHELELAVRDAGVNYGKLRQAIMMLCGQGILLPVQDEATIDHAKAHTEQLNAHFLQKARSSGDLGYLASPVTGGGYPVSRFEQLYLLAQQQGHSSPEAWANFAWGILAIQGQAVIKDGKSR